MFQNQEAVMAGCPKCGFDNPAESRFCASCGAPLPVTGKCPGCGADNPPGSKFCKQCGKPLADAGQSVLQGGANTSWQTGGLQVTGGSKGAFSGDLRMVRKLLFAAMLLVSYAAFMNYSSMETLQAYLGPYADTSTSTFLLILDAVLIGLSGYAAVQLDQGDTGLAKKAMAANAMVGGLALFLFHSNLQEIMLNGSLLAIGIWGLRLLNQARRTLV
jgi:hypothetical protein